MHEAAKAMIKINQLRCFVKEDGFFSVLFSAGSRAFSSRLEIVAEFVFFFARRSWILRLVMCHSLTSQYFSSRDF
jgi:hypothetical protein